MISWIQRSFHRHFKIVFAALIGVMALPLVFIYSASGGLGQAERNYRTAKFFGLPFTTDAERRVVIDDGSFSLFLTSGQPYFQPDVAQVHAFRRAAALHLADTHGIPQPTARQLQDFIEQLPAFRGQDGRFDPEIYTRLKDNFRTNPQYTEARVRRIIEQDWRIAAATRSLGGAGFAIDSEVMQAVSFVDTKWSMDVATVSLDKLPAPAEPTEEQIRQWFEANSFRYKVPARVRVSYVEFPAAAFTGSVSVTDEQIVRYFEENKSRYKQPVPAPAPAADGETPVTIPTPAEPTLEQVRTQVIADVTHARARTAAAKAASDFAYLLFDKGIARNTPVFDNLLVQKNLALKNLPPLAPNQAPAGLAWNQQATAQAFRLDDKHPVSDAILVGDTAMVLFFDEKLPEADATLADVRDRAVAELKADRQQRAHVSEGQSLRARLTAAVAAGQSFADAAKADGLEVKSWSDFTIRNAPADMERAALAVMEEQPLKEISPLRVLDDRGLFVLVSKREAPALVAEGEQFTQMRSNLLSREARTLSGQLLDEMVEKELVAAGLANQSE